MLSQLIAGTALVFGFAGSASGQVVNHPLVGVGISFLDDVSATGVGFAVDLAQRVKVLNKISLAVVGDVGLNFFDFETVTMVQAGVRVNFTTPNVKVKPFAQGLAGWAHFNASDCSGPSCINNEFVFTPGGGIDLALNDRVNFRGQLDFPMFSRGPFDLPAGFDTDIGEHDVRFWFGISYQVGR